MSVCSYLSTKADFVKVSGRTSCGILIFTVAVSLSHLIVLLGFDIFIQKPYILCLYDSIMIKST